MRVVVLVESKAVSMVEQTDEKRVAKMAERMAARRVRM